jgi:hypothetical protein
MITAGVDLSAQDTKTALCAIEWDSRRARVARLQVGCTDGEILTVLRCAGRSGIDAPFGWPEAMVTALAIHAAGGPWPAHATPESLRYRETDRFVVERTREAIGTALHPLSVSSDRIAVCAWRCTRILTALGEPVDRSGTSGSAAEVYPAAALALWSIPRKGYKAPASHGIREAILDALVETASGLEIGSEARASCIDVDHALDALVSALVARAVARGLTTGPDETRSAAAAHEGWIHLPRPDSLAHLVG